MRKAAFIYNVLNMNILRHKSDTRGYADHGWLKSFHTFSFANYYNPERIQFGSLRVLNDDEIAPSMGFGTHPHKNMEIVSIPLTGSLKHKDNMDNELVLYPNEIQCMTAGSGIMHSEYNNSDEQISNFLQIWVFPYAQDLKPGYDQMKFDFESNKNEFIEIISPEETSNSLKINQNAWFYLGKFDRVSNINYSFNLKGNLLYIFIIEGGLKINEQSFNRRDGIGISETNKIDMEISNESYILLMEIPEK